MSAWLAVCGAALVPVPPQSAPHTAALLCCAVVAQCALALPDMKLWAAGEKSLLAVAAEGTADPLGAALLRFALGGLGGKRFWAQRAVGYSVYAMVSAHWRIRPRAI